MHPPFKITICGTVLERDRAYQHDGPRDLVWGRRGKPVAERPIVIDGGYRAVRIGLGEPARQLITRTLRSVS